MPVTSSIVTSIQSSTVWCVAFRIGRIRRFTGMSAEVFSHWIGRARSRRQVSSASEGMSAQFAARLRPRCNWPTDRKDKRSAGGTKMADYAALIRPTRCHRNPAISGRTRWLAMTDGSASAAIGMTRTLPPISLDRTRPAAWQCRPRAPAPENLRTLRALAREGSESWQRVTISARRALKPKSAKKICRRIRGMVWRPAEFLGFRPRDELKSFISLVLRDVNR